MQLLYLILAIILLLVWVGPHILIGLALYFIIIMWKEKKSASNSEPNRFLTNNINSSTALEKHSCSTNTKEKKPNTEKDRFEISKQQGEKIIAVTNAILSNDTSLEYKVANRLLSFCSDYWNHWKVVKSSNLYDFIIETAEERCRSAKRDFVKKECKQVIQIVKLLRADILPNEIVRTLSHHTSVEPHSIEMHNNEISSSKIAMKKCKVSTNVLRTYDKSRGQLCRWIAPNEIIEVQGIILTRGNFYIGECFLLPNYILREKETAYIYASVLNPDLQASNTEYREETFCSYYDMSPAWRYKYLMWLSGKTDASKVPTEILLFYLYGCEIRMFIDSQTINSERWTILCDAIKLYETLDFDSKRDNGRELQSKLCDFIVYAIYKYFQPTMEDLHLRNLLINRSTYRSFYINYVALRIHEKKDYSLDCIFEYANYIYEIENIVSSKYIAIAREYFKEDFAESCISLSSTLGMICKHDQQICYYQSNSKFNSETVNMLYDLKTINNVWVLDDVIKNCCWNIDSKFRSYNDVMKQMHQEENIAAFFLLPDKVNVITIPKIQAVISRIDNEMQSEAYLVRPINWLLDLWEYKQNNDKSIHIEYVNSIISGLRRIGFGIIPDYALDRRRFDFGDDCVIYRNKKHLQVNLTTMYEHSVLFINLATQIVRADQANNSDIRFIEHQLKAYNQNDGNYLHLSALARWKFLSKKQSIDKWSQNIIKTMKCEERTLMGKTLMMLTFTDGRIHLKRIGCLKQVLSLLEIETDGIYSYIHNLYNNNEGFAVIEKESDEVEYSIKGNSLTNQQSGAATVIIDSKKLQLLEQQTKAAHSLLSDIFVEKEEIPHNSVSNNVPKRWMNILELLFKKEIWKRKEVEDICNEQGLMIGAVLEQINDFAYEKVDDAVVEDDGNNIYVTINYKNILL